jgi:hypothetical protein
MANPLFTAVKRNDEVIIGINQRWGAGAWNRVSTMCRILACVDRNASVSVLLEQIGKAVPDAWISDNGRDIREMEQNACDIQFICLDGVNTVFGALEPDGEIAEAGEYMRLNGYSEDEIAEELETIANAPQVYPWMKEDITKENAFDILSKWNAESSDTWIDENHVYRAFLES